MIFNDANARFVEEVTNGLSKFGINSEKSSVGSSKDTTIFHMHNTVNDSEYIAIGKRKKGGNGAEKSWKEIIDNDLISTATSYLENGQAPAGALIVPSVDASTVIALLEERGAEPTVYQLFDGYVVVGLTKQDIRLVSKPQEANIDEPTEPAKVEQKPTQPNTEQPPIDTPTSEPKSLADELSAVANNEPVTKEVILEKAKSTPMGKKIIAAAMLGVALGAVPFVAEYLQDGVDTHVPITNAPTNPTASQQFFSDVTEGTADDMELLKILANNPEATEDFLRSIADSPVATEVLKNPNTPKDIIEKAYNSNDLEKLKAIAQNPNTSLGELEKLSKNVNSDVRASVAKNPSIPKDMMDKLANDVPKVRNALLDNQKLTPDIHDIIAKQGSDDCEFLEKLMANPCVSPDVLNYNGRNTNSCTRLGVASNPNTSPEALEKLATDENEDVRHAALKNPNIPEHILKNILTGDLKPTTDAERLKDIKASLQNSAIHPDVMKKALATSPMFYADDIASNPSIDKPLMEHMQSLAKGKKGLQSFIDDSIAIKDSPNMQADIKNSADRSFNGDVEKALRSKLNKDFANDVFDPYKLASLSEGTFDKDKKLSNFKAPEKFGAEGPENIAYSMADMADTATTFSNATNTSALGAGGNSGGSINQSPLHVADSIVNNVMGNVMPSLSGGSAGGTSGANGDGSGEGLGEFSDGASGDSSIGGESLGGKGSDVATAAMHNGFNFSPVPQNLNDKEVSDWIFKNSCDNIDTLTNIL